jgi:tripartite-type tricarboxylate transporter receptor subunit TctC
MRNPLVMEVNPSVPAKTVPKFIAYAKANPGKLNAGTGGIGSPQHMAVELFKMMADVNLELVHYRGSAPLLTDLLRGELHVAFEPMLSSIGHI